MKYLSAILVLGLGVISAVAQELAPSPTESVGCVPHGDHWHCEGPAPATSAEPVESPTIAPSPTESVGCVPHGDHWHCEGPRPTDEPAVTTSTVPVITTPTTTTTSHEEDHGDSASLAPSPTESVGCEPHGDHWHCDGPAVTMATVTTTTSGAAAGTGSPSSTRSAPSSVVTAGAALHQLHGAVGVVGLAALVVAGI
ncbi:hypothetical protein N656DRAFT_828859 [Canariomyces notabilis]|uniref:Uncharacterized protein n=1 Tax=Canariomyces notabilis TaxID=2074819 RepID=A0AAN6TEX4_9PEZI|nr:hypothetical protein N656DRAFT_828859 [Canariomyces arenarius]